jgi:hypothetical protein
MIIQRINRTNPEKVFIVCRNDTSAAIPKGFPCDFVVDGTRDGIDVTDTNTGNAALSTLLAGLCDSALAASQYGLVQCYGIRTDAPLYRHTTTSYALGDALVLYTASSMLSRVAAGAISAYLPGIVCGKTVATSNATSSSTSTVFLRLM